MRKYTKDETVVQFIELHGEQYDYTEMLYNGNAEKVKIICKEHGDFYMSPNSHKAGRGCPKCGYNVISEKGKLSQEQVILDFREVHGNRYSYILVNYISSSTNVRVICRHHGIFNITPNNHKMGRGCPSCSKGGFDFTKPAILYYVKFNLYNLYKIGVTNSTVKRRFGEEYKKIEVVRTIPFANGRKCQMVEQKILNRYRHRRYLGDPILKGGNTEIFDGNVLGWY